MQFKDLKFGAFSVTDDYERSQILRFKEHEPVAVFRHVEKGHYDITHMIWSDEYDDWVADYRRGNDDEGPEDADIIEGMDLIELCAGVLPFCEPLPEEVTHE